MATDVAEQVLEQIELSQLEKEHYAQIVDKNTEVAKLLMEWQQLKGDASEAKKDYDQTVSELTYLIARGPDKQNKLPFDDDCLAWMDRPIAGELGLTAKELEKLEAAGATTIGQLETIRGEDGGLMGVKGIGRATADKIEDQLIDWLSENRELITSEDKDGGEDETEEEDETVEL